MVSDAVTAARPLSFSTRLRADTDADHDQVERLLDLPFRLEHGRDLARLLTGWYGIWTDVRAGLGGARQDEAARLLVSAVRALQRIRADLHDLDAGFGVADMINLSCPLPTGYRPDQAAAVAAVLAVESGVWAAGYVLRGSRVGGAVLAPLIAQRLRLPTDLATRYHADEAAGPAWVAFRDRLDFWGRAANEAAQQATIQAAHHMYGLVGDRLLAAVSPAS